MRESMSDVYVPLLESVSYFLIALSIIIMIGLICNLHSLALLACTYVRK